MGAPATERAKQYRIKARRKWVTHLAGLVVAAQEAYWNRYTDLEGEWVDGEPTQIERERVHAAFIAGFGEVMRTKKMPTAIEVHSKMIEVVRELDGGKK